MLMLTLLFYSDPTTPADSRRLRESKKRDGRKKRTNGTKAGDMVTNQPTSYRMYKADTDWLMQWESPDFLKNTKFKKTSFRIF